MYKLLSCAALGLTTAGLTLVTPEQSQAGPPRVSVRFGRFGFSSGGHGHHGHGSHYRHSPRYSSYGSSYYRSRSCGSSYYGGSRYYRRPTVVHPETYHYTPRRGLHTHGHLHVPHGSHYHTVPY